jgi:hypothetical protein
MVGVWVLDVWIVFWDLEDLRVEILVGGEREVD